VTSKKKKKKNNSKSNKSASSQSITLLNRKAYSEFDVLDTLSTGIVLQGTEVKSLRLGRGQLTESFVRIDKKLEAYLYGMTIPHYEFGNRHNHDTTRVRKLLLQKKELLRWQSKIERENLTIIVLKLYFRRSWAKLEIALAKRKKLHDKRRELRQKTVNREIQRELKRAY